MKAFIFSLVAAILPFTALAGLPANPRPAIPIALVPGATERIVAGTLLQAGLSPGGEALASYRLEKKNGTVLDLVVDASVAAKARELVGKPVIAQGVSARNLPTTEGLAPGEVFYVYVLEFDAPLEYPPSR